MPLDLLHSAVNLGTALVLGAVIGFERQWRQRLAGLHTNTLPALGAAGFVVFSQLVEHDASPTRVAAQVVSGIGFLDAGVIFKEGLNVRGLKTAATPCCSAAVGVLSGIGSVAEAALLAALVVGVNLLLRPLVRLIHMQPAISVLGKGEPVGYAVTVVCRGAEEARVRTVLLQGSAASGSTCRGWTVPTSRTATGSRSRPTSPPTNRPMPRWSAWWGGSASIRR